MYLNYPWADTVLKQHSVKAEDGVVGREHTESAMETELINFAGPKLAAVFLF